MSQYDPRKEVRRSVEYDAVRRFLDEFQEWFHDDFDPIHTFPEARRCPSCGKKMPPTRFCRRMACMQRRLNCQYNRLIDKTLAMSRQW